MILDRLSLSTLFRDNSNRSNMELHNKFDSIFLAIDEYVKFLYYECSEVDESYVVKIYEIAGKLEQLFAEMEANNLVPAFNKKLEEFWKMKGRFPDFELGFLKSACNHLLTDHLSNPELRDEIVKCSIDQYLIHCSSDRFKQVTSDIIKTRQAFLELSDFVEKNCHHSDIEARIIFDQFCVEFTSNNRNLQWMEIDLTTLFAGGKNCQILFRILSFEYETAIQASAAKFIVSFIISNKLILEGRYLCKSLFSIPPCKLCHIFKRHPIILDSVFELISNSLEQHQCSYSGKDIIWICEDSNLLSYSDMVEIFKTLIALSLKFEELVRNFIHSRKSTALVKEIEIESFKPGSRRDYFNPVYKHYGCSHPACSPRRS